MFDKPQQPELQKLYDKSELFIMNQFHWGVFENETLETQKS